MTNSAAPDVKRVAGAARTEESPAPANPRLSPRSIAVWTAGMGLFALVLVPIGDAIAREVSLQAMIQADHAAMEVYRPVLPGLQQVDTLEAMSEIALSADDIDLALDSARKAASADPGRPFVWATLAYLETEKAGRASPAALDALGKSIAACPLCDEELIRWRFRYVLANWADIPEDLRRKTFETADILRWTGRNADFLAEMRIKSMAAGVPFDQYRAGVKSPVHTWELDFIEPSAAVAAPVQAPAATPAPQPEPELRLRSED